MTAFPIIEHYRNELGRTRFARISEADQMAMDERHEGAVQSLAIEGLHGSPEISALFQMLSEERVSPSMRTQIVDRYVREQLVPNARVADVAIAS